MYRKKQSKKKRPREDKRVDGEGKKNKVEEESSVEAVVEAVDAVTEPTAPVEVLEIVKPAMEVSHAILIALSIDSDSGCILRSTSQRLRKPYRSYQKRQRQNSPSPSSKLCPQPAFEQSATLKKFPSFGQHNVHPRR